MAVSLNDINQDNFRACTKLSVREDQPFVASNSFSIAESKLFPFWIIKAIYSDEDMVGFMMYTKNYEEGELYLCRFMIDSKFQGKGFGKEALKLLKDIANKDECIKTMKLSTSPENTNGIRIYEKFGFVDTKTMDDDEEVFILKIRK
jgi:diamine N-acetyltransferase